MSIKTSDQVVDHIRGLRTETIEILKSFNMIVQLCESFGFQRKVDVNSDVLSGIEDIYGWIYEELNELRKRRLAESKQ